MTTNLIEKTKSSLEAVISGDDLDVNIVNSMTDKLRFDASVLAAGDGVVLALLPPAIGVLKYSATEHVDGLDGVVELIEALLSRKSFTEVLTLIPLDDLLTAAATVLVPSLQVVAIQQLSKVSTEDLIQHKEILQTLVEQLADPETKSIKAFESCLVKLAQGEAGLRQLESGNTYAVLKKMHNSNNSVLIGRVLEVAKGLVAIDPVAEFTSLIQFDPEIFNPAHWDVLLVSTIITYYREILSNSNVVRALENELYTIAYVYSKRSEEPEVRMFLQSDIVGLFGTLSRHYPEEFHAIDAKYKIVEDSLTDQEDRVRVLTMLGPKYLLQYHKSALKTIKYDAKDVSALRNLLSDQESFEFMAPTQAQILQLNEYDDKMFILSGVLKTEAGLHALLSTWPGVMNEIVHPTSAVSNPQSLDLRREVLEILVDAKPSDLGVWYGPVREAYRELIFGKNSGNAPQVAIAHKSA